MFEREMKANLKNFIIWLGVLIVIFLIAYLMYPSIIKSDSVKMIDELIKIFPEEILVAFNMDISSMDSAYGWLKSEGFVLALLVMGAYAGILGSNILLKEESDKTIEYLNSLPITRNNIIFNKVVAGLIYIILMIVLFGIFNLISLTISGTFNLKQYLLLSITPILSSVTIYFICLFISTFTHKTKKINGISLGIVLMSYVFYIMSQMNEATEFLKYASVFTLADIRNVIIDTKINIVMILMSIILSIIFLILTIINYNRKELL